VQREIWLYQELAGTIGLYNLVITVSLRGQLDIGALERALQDIDRESPALRTAFWFDQDDLISAVRPSHPPRLQVRRLEDWAIVAEEISVAGARSADLASGRLWSYALLSRCGQPPTDEQESILLLTFHHIAVDGISVAVLLARMAAWYRRHLCAAGAVHMVKELRSIGRLETDPVDLAFWRRMLMAAPEPVRLPGQLVSSTIGDLSGLAIPVVLDGIWPERLRALAAKRGATLQAAILSCAIRALADSTGQTDLLLGVPISRRLADAPMDAVGQCTSAMPVRFDVSGAIGAVAMLDRVSDRMRNVLAHPRVDPAEVFSALRAARAGYDGPVFEIVFAWEEATPPLDMPGLAASWRLEFNGWSEWGMTIGLSFEDGRVLGRIYGRQDRLARVDLDSFTRQVAACGHNLLAELVT
jgi:arthrofactin-type cyclic lipopeptide synthetase C